MLFRRRPPRVSATANRSQSRAAEDNRYRIRTLAARQRGLVTWAQLRRRGVANAVITRAIAAGRLMEVMPGVYSTVAPELMTVEARHAAAILKGGEGAVLCGESAEWWLGLREAPPAAIEVAIRGEREPVPGVRWRRLRLQDAERDNVHQMPVTVPARVPLDVAAGRTVPQLKRLLAELEYHHGVAASDVVVRPGYAGGQRLRQAIREHTPELARTRDELERVFVERLTSAGFALPACNHPVGKSTVDAVYAEQGVVIELDGVRGHSGERRVLRDHRRDLHRRADGLLVLRYHFTQIREDWALIAAELDRLGIPRVDDPLRG